MITSIPPVIGIDPQLITNGFCEVANVRALTTFFGVPALSLTVNVKEVPAFEQFITIVDKNTSEAIGVFVVAVVICNPDAPGVEGICIAT